MSPLQKLFALIYKYERFLFVIAVLFVSGEVLSHKWLLTEDGPAHIWNATAYRVVASDPESVINNTFEHNKLLIPNFLSHYILSRLTAFLPLDISDKIFHLLLVFGSCFSFRFLTGQINKEERFYSWLIFPFIYSGIYFLGFYNFSLGLVLALLSSATWLWSEKRNHDLFSTVLLVVLSTLLLLTHLIPFLLFLFIAGARVLYCLFIKDYKAFLKKSIYLAIVILPAAIILTIYYNGRSEATGGFAWADPYNSFLRMIRLTYLAIYDIKEATVALYLSAVIFLAAIVTWIIRLKNRKSISPDERRKFIFWNCCWLFLLACVFFAPNDFGGSGELIQRLIEISTILLLLMITSGKLPKAAVFSLAIFSFSVAMIMTDIRKEKGEILNNEVKKVMRISESIAPNATGVYIPYVSDWLLLHAGELAFAEKKSSLLSNYETIHDFFPLVWKKDFPVNYTLGGLPSSEMYCNKCFWPAHEDKPEKHIDFVLLCNSYVEDTACANRLHDTLAKYYVLKREEPPFYLYQSNQSIKAGMK